MTWTRRPQDSCQTCSSFRSDTGVCAQHGIVVFAPEAKWCEEYSSHGSMGEIAAQVQQAYDDRDRALVAMDNMAAQLESVTKDRDEVVKKHNYRDAQAKAWESVYGLCVMLGAENNGDARGIDVVTDFIKGLSKEREESVRVLRDIFNCQGEESPLPVFEEHWQSAMKRAAAILGKVWPN